MQFFIISHFFFMKISLDIKTCICFLEKKCSRISEISFLPSLRTDSSCTLWDKTPCTKYTKLTEIYMIETIVVQQQGATASNNGKIAISMMKLMICHWIKTAAAKIVLYVRKFPSKNSFQTRSVIIDHHFCPKVSSKHGSLLSSHVILK